MLGKRRQRVLETYYKRLIDEIRDFMRLESAAGMLLLPAALLALIAPII